MDDRSAEIFDELKKLDVLMGKRANALFSDADISFSQAGVLKLLASRRGSDTSNRQIEEHFGISNPAASGLVKRLVEKDLVESQVDQYDKRFRNVRITREGLELSQRMHGRVEQLNGRMLEGFSKEEEQEALRLIRKMHDNLL